MRLFGVVLAVATLGGCGAREGGGGAGDADSVEAGGGGGRGECAIENRRRRIDVAMRDYYLFAERVPAVRLGEHGSDESLLEALRVDPPDRYSYLIDESRYDATHEEGVTFGFGWGLLRTDPDTLLFSNVMPGSPVARAGIVRGERLVAIGGLPLEEYLALPAAERDRILGLPDTPVSVVLGVDDAAGARRDVTVRSERFPIVTVEATDIVEHAGTRVGYLRFASFLQTSLVELEAAFDTLAGERIGELVLDLRYNGGGRVSVAADLAGGIGGGALAGETFAAFRQNERYAASDVEIDFGQRLAALDLARVIVLSTARTCSASELVVNALEPFIDVVTVGSSTCGKPYGTFPDRHCGRVLNALSVRFENAAGVGGYTDGLTPDCPVEENLRTAMGGAGDPLYETALGIVANGRCEPLARRSAPAPVGAPYPDPVLSGSDPLLDNAVLP